VGKLVAMRMYSWAGGVATHEDRLGSVARRGSTNRKYFPYGEEPTTTAQNETKFATYYRDSTTALDYARNRYYARTIGRFTSPDPSEPGDPSDPQSWNYYAYVGNEPVNSNDPEGLGCLGFSFCASVNPTPQPVTLQLPFVSLSFTTTPTFSAYWPVLSYFPAPSTPQRKITSSGNTTMDKVRRQIYDSDSDPIFGAEILDCMAGLETGLTWNPNLDSKSGTYKGLYQFSFGAWSQAASGYSYTTANVHNAAVSTIVAVKELYKKLRAVAGLTNYTAFVSAKEAARPWLEKAISAWESLNGGTQYGSSVLDCADDMKRGDFTAAKKHIQTFLDYRHAHPL
jgi:RHS repeat-associated protein